MTDFYARAGWLITVFSWARRYYIKEVGLEMARALTSIISVLIFTMTAAIFTQVMTRYVLHISLPFLQFVIAFSMSWLTMLGAALGVSTSASTSP